MQIILELIPHKCPFCMPECLGQAAWYNYCLLCHGIKAGTWPAHLSVSKEPVPSWEIWLSFSLWGRTGLLFGGLVTVLLSHHPISLEGLWSTVINGEVEKAPECHTEDISRLRGRRRKKMIKQECWGSSHPLLGSGDLLSSTACHFSETVNSQEARLLFSLCNTSSNNNNNSSFKIFILFKYSWFYKVVLAFYIRK